MSKPQPIRYNIVNMTVNVPNFTTGYYRQDFYRQRVKYDDSIWPFVKKENDTTYFSTNSINPAIYLPRNDNVNNTNSPEVTIFTGFNSDIKTYERKVNKIDYKFSYYGGILAFLIFFFRFFFFKYNQYSYEINVAESSFNLDSDGKKVAEKQLNGLTYLSFSLYKWIKNLCCSEPQWEQSKRMNKTIKEVVNVLDAGKLLRKIEFL